MRKRIGLFLALLAACTMIWCCAGAESYGPESFGPGGSMKWSVDNGAMILSGTGAVAGYDAEHPENTPWMDSKHAALMKSVTEIRIEDGVTGVNANAFDCCVNAEKLVLPDTLISFVNSTTYANQFVLYANPDSQTAKALSEGNGNPFWTKEGVKYNVFADSNGMEISYVKTDTVHSKVSIPRGITGIREKKNGSLFADTRMKELILPDTMRELPKGAFKGLVSLEKVTFSSGVTVGADAFSACGALTVTLTGKDAANVVFPENAFAQCSNLVFRLEESVPSLPECLIANEDTKKATFYAPVGPVYDRLKEAGAKVRFLSFVPEVVGTTDNYYSVTHGRTTAIQDLYTVPYFDTRLEDPDLKPVFVFTSLDENIATVDEEGVIYGVNPGETRIKVAVKDHPEVEFHAGLEANGVKDYITVVVEPIGDGPLDAFISGTSNGKILSVSFGASNGTPPYHIIMEINNGGAFSTKTFNIGKSGETAGMEVKVNEDKKTKATQTIRMTVTDAKGETTAETLKYAYNNFGTTTKSLSNVVGWYVENGERKYGYKPIYTTTYAWEARISASNSYPSCIRSISMTPELLLTPGDTELLNPSVTPGDKGSLAWYSSNNQVARVDTDGNVTALKPGKAVITAKSTDTLHASAECSVYVVESPVESIEIQAAGKDETAQTQQLTVKVLPDNASVKDVKWTSSDPEFAPIDENGTITWKDNMKAVFTAAAVDGSSVTASLGLEWTSCPKTITEEYELYQFNDDTWGTLDRNQAYGLIGVDLRLRFYSNGTMGLEIWQDGEHQVVDHITCTEDGLTYHTKDSLFATYFKRIGDGLIETDALYRGTMKLIELGKAPARIDNPTLVSAWKLDRMEQYGTVKYLEELQKTRPTLDEHYRLYNNDLVKMTTVKDGEERTIPYSTNTSAYMINGKTFERFNGELRVRSDYDSIYSYYIPEDHEYTGPGAPPLPGDVNEDGAVDGRDVLRLMKYLAAEEDEETGEPIEINYDNADVDGSGNINEKDLLRLIQYLGGEKVELLPGAMSGNG